MAKNGTSSVGGAADNGNDVLSPNFSEIPREFAQNVEHDNTIKLVTSSAGALNPNTSVLDDEQKQKQKQNADLSNLHNDSYASVTIASDKSHRYISQLFQDGNSSLNPRMKTIDLYRQNAKKSTDPYVLFQFAQYLLQTALLMDETELAKTEGKGLGQYENIRKDLIKESKQYLKSLSDKGYVEAQYLLGDAFSSGVLGKIDNEKAFQLFQAAAKHGHVESGYRAAHCFEEGIGVQRDAKKAIQFLKSAASRNHPAAMFKLGVYSYYGKMGLGKDDNTKKSGIKWLTIAVSKANELTCAAPYELAKIYETGFKDIVIPDKKYALELYVQAASLGHIPSALILGRAYELGQDVPQDANLSIHYFTQAALGGNAEAMLSMCAWYLVGAEPFLKKDEKEAFAWAMRSANLNYPKAQFAVGHFLEKGIGCEIDLEESQKWVQKAARNGDLRAKQKIGNNVEVHKEAKDKDCVIM